MTATENGPIIICVYGATGTGKSTFINDVTGVESLPVGHGQTSCTAEVTAVSHFSIDGREICLVDSPGFDDTSMKDSEVLEKIGDFMAKTYHDKQLLTGIIYMHRITDVRFSGVAKKNFRVFRKLCGPNAMKNLIICTNMWPNPSDPADPIHLQLESREEELRTSPQIFQPAMAEGARMTRYTRHKGPTHAQEIVRLCLANIPVATLYQEEVSRGARLGDTSAGRVLEEDMQRLIKDHKAEIARLVRDHEEAIRKKDEVTRREIQEEREEREKALAKLNENIVALKKSLGDANRKGEEDRVRYEKSQQERDEKIKQLEAKIAGLRERLEIETDPGVIARLKQQIDDSLGKIKNLCWDWFY